MSSRSTARLSSPNATAPFEPRARPSSGVRRACPWMCHVPVTSRLVTFSACSGLLVQRSWLYSGFDLCFPRVRTVFFLASLTLCSKQIGHCASCCFGGTGFVREVSNGTVIDCVLVEANDENLAAAAHLYLQQQAAASPGYSPLKGKGVRTGGRLHPGLAGECLLKQRPKLLSCLLRRPRGNWGLREDVPGSWLGVRGCVLRTEVYCVPACLPALPLLGVLLIAFAFLLFARLFRTGCLPFCMLAALDGFAPGALAGLGPPAFSVPGTGHTV